jgi:hypothetical protein
MYPILIFKINTEVKKFFLGLVSVLFVIFYLKIVFLGDSKNFKDFTDNKLNFNFFPNFGFICVFFNNYD